MTLCRPSCPPTTALPRTTGGDDLATSPDSPVEEARILVVDDDPTAVTLMRHPIEREGFTRGYRLRRTAGSRPHPGTAARRRRARRASPSSSTAWRCCARSCAVTSAPEGPPVVLGVSGDVTARTAVDALGGRGRLHPAPVHERRVALRVRRLASRTRSLRRALAYSRFLERRTGFLVAIPSPLHRPIPFRVGADHGRGSRRQVPRPCRSKCGGASFGASSALSRGSLLDQDRAVELGVSASVGLRQSVAREHPRGQQEQARDQAGRTASAPSRRWPTARPRTSRRRRVPGRRNPPATRRRRTSFRGHTTRSRSRPGRESAMTKAVRPRPLASTVIGATARRTAPPRAVRLGRRARASPVRVLACNESRHDDSNCSAVRRSPPSGAPIVTVGAGREGRRTPS